MKDILRQRILHVDESDAGRHAVSRNLRRAGFEVIEAANGADALRLAAQGPDLILLDVNLPDINGFEVCQRLKANPDTASIPVVHLSATYVHPEDQVEGMVGGADGYLTHPIEPRVLVSTIRSLLHLKAVEAAQVESEARFRATFEQAAVGIAHVAPDGRWLRVNQKLCDIVGYAREELLALRFQDITHPDDLEHDVESGRQVLAAEVATYANDKRYLHKNGGIVWTHRTVSLVRKASGEPDYLISVIEDITERKRGEQELIESEERFRSLVEQSLAGTYIIQDGKFTYVNPRAVEILGCDSADQLLGRDPSSLVAEKDRSRVAQNLRDCLDGRISRNRDRFSVQRGDGSLVEVGVHRTRAMHQGRPAIIGLLQDISEKKRAAAQIQDYVSQLEKALMSTVQVATTLSGMRDPYTADHERRVAEVAVAIGAELGFDAHRQQGLRVAGYLHDIGKMSVPSEILAKPGKLRPIEYQFIQGHAQSSYDVLKDVQFPWPVAAVALQHHERLDGSGYPQGLKGEAILLEARIMAVADVVEAMSSHRPYRPGLGIDRALAEIERGRGSAYDPEVADACLKLFREKGYAIPG